MSRMSATKIFLRLLATRFRHPLCLSYQTKSQISSSRIHISNQILRNIIAIQAATLLYYKTSLYSMVFTLGAKQEDVLDRIVEEADRLYSTNKNFKELYDYLKKHADSGSAEILWRLSRAARDLALKSVGGEVDANMRKRLVYEAHDCAKRALAADPLHFAAHKWLAITIGDVGDYEGVKVKIANAFVIKEHLERAIELESKDATTLHCMGMWCYVFADMPWWQRKIASVLFNTPPSATYPEAAGYFLKAELADPNFYNMNLLMLGKTYMKMGDRKRAMLYLDRAIRYPVATEEDRKAKSEAEDLMNEIIASNKT